MGSPRLREGTYHQSSAAEAAPFDVLAAIFLDLDLADLYNCQLVCRSWRHAARDDLILRSLCWRKGYALGRRRLTDLEQPYRPVSGHWDSDSDGHRHPLYRMQGHRDATSWEEVLKRDRLLKRIKFPPQGARVELPVCDPKLHGVVKCYSNHRRELRSDIWQVRVDPIDNVMITTGSRGGLTVLDLETGQELWRDARVVSFARLEHSEGWIVHDHDRGDGQGSYLVIRKFERLVQGLATPRRGHLVSIGTINYSDHPRAWCLVWPHLAIVTGARISILDLRESNPVQDFPLPSSFCRPARYISMDEDFIFVLGGYRAPSPHKGYGEDDEDEDSSLEEGGLFVFERRKRGRLVYDSRRTDLTCAFPWNIERQNLDRLRFKSQRVEGCPSLGIANQLSPGSKSDQARLEHTSWCQAVLPDRRTGSLVLSGRGGLLVIPDYKKAFLRGQEPIFTIGIGAGNIYSRRCSSQLGVADGVAAFISSVHNLPVWVDLRSLVLASSRGSSTTPRASTLCLGQSVLYESTAIGFQKSSSLYLDSTRLVAVADFLQEDASQRPTTLKAYFIAVVMDFGAVLQAKLDSPGEPLEREPSRISISFPRRSEADEEEKARWRKKRDELSSARVVLPSGEAQWWESWAPHLLSDQPLRKRWKAARTFEGAERRREPPTRKFNWRGRVPWGAASDGTHFWDHDFTEKTMIDFFTPLKDDVGFDSDEDIFDDSDEEEKEQEEYLNVVGQFEAEESAILDGSGNGDEEGGTSSEREEAGGPDEDGEEVDDEGEDEDGYDLVDEDESIDEESGDPHDAREVCWTDEEDDFWPWAEEHEFGTSEEYETAASLIPVQEPAHHQVKEELQAKYVLPDLPENVDYSHRQLSQDNQHQLGELDQASEPDPVPFDSDSEEDDSDGSLMDAAINQEVTGGAGYVPLGLRAVLTGSTSYSPELKMKLPIDS